MPPLLLGFSGPRSGNASVRHVNPRTKDAEVQLRKVERWWRSPRHRNSRWAHLIPPEEMRDSDRMFQRVMCTGRDRQYDASESDDEGSESSLRYFEHTVEQMPAVASRYPRQTGQDTSAAAKRATKAKESNPTFEPITTPALSFDSSAGLKLKEASKPQQFARPEGYTYWSSPEGKARITQFFDDPTSSKWAYYMSVSILVTIVVSVIAICMETLPELEHDTCCKDTSHAVFMTVEVLCVTIFTLEYVARFYAASSKCSFFWGAMNLIDLLAILPFYVELVFSDASDLDILKLFRLVRIFRVFKLSKTNKDIQTCIAVLHQCKALFALMVFVLVQIAIVFGFFAYTLEKEYDPETAFITMPEAMWWAIVSVNMVGYGDIYPTTIGGKITGGLAIGLGIGVLALPISVIGNTFSEAWDRTRMEQKAGLAAQNPHGRHENIKQSLATVTTNLERFNQHAASCMDYSCFLYADVMTCLTEVWKRFSRFTQQLFFKQPSAHTEKILQHKFEISLKKWKLYQSSIREWVEYANDHPEYGKYRELTRALQILHDAKVFIKHSEKLLTKCTEINVLYEQLNAQVIEADFTVDPEKSPLIQSLSGFDPKRSRNSPDSTFENLPQQQCTYTAEPLGSLHTEASQATEEVDLDLMQRYFNRYDLDDSGTINNLEELTQLCTNLIVKLGLRMRLDELESLTSEIEDLETQPWDFDHFRDWFLQSLQDCSNNNP